MKESGGPTQHAAVFVHGLLSALLPGPTATCTPRAVPTAHESPTAAPIGGNRGSSLLELRVAPSPLTPWHIGVRGSFKLPMIDVERKPRGEFSIYDLMISPKVQLLASTFLDVAVRPYR